MVKILDGITGADNQAVPGIIGGGSGASSRTFVLPGFHIVIVDIGYPGPIFVAGIAAYVVFNGAISNFVA